MLEQRIAALEGGTAALAVASGHAAQAIVFHTLMEPGDEFVAGRQLYGGSVNQFNHSFKKFDWRVKWADATDPASFAKAVTPKTRAIFCESIANPGGIVVDLPAISAIARKAGVPLIVDNTLATPYLCRPKEFGADIIVHSLTKFLGGHGNSIGGAIVDCGTYDWLAAKHKYTALVDPNPSYNGMRLAETFGNFAFAIAARVLGLRDLGPALSPFNAFLILTGMETLPLRMAEALRQCARRRQVSGQAQGGGVGELRRPAQATSTTRWPRRSAPRARAPSSPSASRAATRRASSSSPTSSCSRTSPTSATSGASSSIPPPPPTASSPTSSGRPPAPAPTWCASPSASRTPTTSSPTWSRGWRVTRAATTYVIPGLSPGSSHPQRRS